MLGGRKVFRWLEESENFNSSGADAEVSPALQALKRVHPGWLRLADIVLENPV